MIQLLKALSYVSKKWRWRNNAKNRCAYAWTVFSEYLYAQYYGMNAVCDTLAGKCILNILVNQVRSINSKKI